MKSHRLILAVTIISALVVTFGFMGQMQALASAVVVSLGTADSFAVLAGSGITNTGATTITGDVGSFPTLTQTGFGTVTLTGTNHVGDATTQGAKTALDTAFTDASQAPSVTYAPVYELGGQTLLPGVYNDPSSFGITGTVTLDGGGDPDAVFIFQTGSTLTTASASHVKLINSAQACNVFWQVGSSATLGTYSDFKGNILAADSITDNGYSTILGRLLARGAAVTLNNTTLVKATCGAVAPVVPATLHINKHMINDNGGVAVASDFMIGVSGTGVSSSSFAGSEAGSDISLSAGAYTVSETGPAGYTSTNNCSGTILAGETETCTITNNDIPTQLTVTKVVVNNSGGTKVIADFPLFIDGTLVTSGIASTTHAGIRTISETSDAGYTSTIGGDCALNGTITIAQSDIKLCTITNDDIPHGLGGGGSGGNPNYTNYTPTAPPLIEVIKVPNPLALPAGPGNVAYTFTLRNIGTVAVSDVTMVDDSCSSVTYISGDANSDGSLDVSESWVYRCSTRLSATHTNTVVATGWANGLSVTDIANATVVVGASVVPPLIHVTKTPSPLVLSAGGGMVTYTKRVSNPGVVALSNVRLTDDKCNPVTYISGDANGDTKLDVSETWVYSCSVNLTQTTTNTAVVTGEANGIIARDFALATVVVGGVVPSFPDTGTAPDERHIPPRELVFAGVLMMGTFGLVTTLKRYRFI